MHILELLEDEHQRLVDVVDALAHTTARQQKQRGALLEELVRELLAHVEAEREVVYERLQVDPSVEGLLARARAEHSRLERLGRGLLQIVDEGAFRARLATLRGAIVGHVVDDERALLTHPALREADAGGGLALAFLAAKDAFGERYGSERERQKGGEDKADDRPDDERRPDEGPLEETAWRAFAHERAHRA